MYISHRWMMQPTNLTLFIFFKNIWTKKGGSEHPGMCRQHKYYITQNIGFSWKLCQRDGLKNTMNFNKSYQLQSKCTVLLHTQIHRGAQIWLNSLTNN